MKVYLFTQKFTKKEVEHFSKKECHKFCFDCKPISWLENYLNADAVGLDIFVRIA